MRANEFITESSPILVNPVIKNNANAMAVIKHLFNKESKWRIGHQADLHEVDFPTQSNFIVGPKGAVFFQRRLKYIVSSIKNKLTVKVTTSVKLDIDKIALLVGSPTKYYSVDTGQVLHKPNTSALKPIVYSLDLNFQRLYKLIVEKLYNQYSLVGDVPETLERIYDEIPLTDDVSDWHTEFYNSWLGTKFQRGFYSVFIPRIKEIFKFEMNDSTMPEYIYAEAIRTDKQLLYKEFAKFIREFVITFI